MVAHLISSASAPLERLPGWATLVRAPNPGPMTLDGTNTWVLRAPGVESCLVVDPGPLDEDHLAAVSAYGPVRAIVVTHGHPDHTDGVPRLVELTGAPVLDDAEAIAAAGIEVGLRVEVRPTPGHTNDSVCFVVSSTASAAPNADNAVLTGDTVLGRGTTVVAWPDGDLGRYLDSLRWLASIASMPALPGHGPALDSVSNAARSYLAHREARLDQVREALAGGARTPEEVVARVYADVDRTLWPAAELSVRAQLDYLRDPAAAPPPTLDRRSARDPAAAPPPTLDRRSARESLGRPKQLDEP